MNDTIKVVEKWKLSKLKDYYKQAAMFGDVGDEELDVLVESMREGLRVPIEILPDGTIICGHQRVRAATLLGWKEIDVVVLHDLAKAGPAAIERYFVEDNYVRRQLSPLACARCIKRLMELEEARDARQLDYGKKEALKTKIGKRMSASLRTVNRYLLLLDSPLSVQHACERGEISLINAGKVALMETWSRSEIAARIEDGEKAATVVGEYLSAAKNCTNGLARSFDKICRTLSREMIHLKTQVDKLRPDLIGRDIKLLRDALAMFQKLIAHAKLPGRSLPKDPLKALEILNKKRKAMERP